MLSTRAKLALIIFIINLAFSLRAHAFFQDLESGHYQQPALIGVGATLGIYVTSQMHDGPAIFTGLYGMGALYLMNEYYASDSPTGGGEFYEDEIIVPLSMVTMSVINIALLHDSDRFSKHDVFIYNWVGAGLITAYAIWEHKNESRALRRKHDALSWAPFIETEAISKKNYTGLAWIKNF